MSKEPNFDEYTITDEEPQWFQVQDYDLVVMSDGVHGRPGYREMHEVVRSGKIDGGPVQYYVNEGWELNQITRAYGFINPEDYSMGFA